MCNSNSNQKDREISGASKLVAIFGLFRPHMYFRYEVHTLVSAIFPHILPSIIFIPIFDIVHSSNLCFKVDIFLHKFDVILL